MQLNPRQPLFLPPGSVRAIIAIVLVGAMIAFDPSKIGELAAVVVAFYFAAKAAAAK